MAPRSAGEASDPERKYDLRGHLLLTRIVGCTRENAATKCLKCRRLVGCYRLAGWYRPIHWSHIRNEPQHKDLEIVRSGRKQPELKSRIALQSRL